MIDREHTTFVQMNNLTTTFNLLFAMRDLAPDAHLLKLGTMGEYGTPNVDIPEGFFEVEYRGRKDRMPFPRQAPSWYHWSKVHGSNNIMFACKIWGIRATDVMQGVVFGPGSRASSDDPRLRTRLDFDQAFGTAINRFSCQAVIEHPLTPYGAGGQVRGFLPLRDSMQCLTLGLENPPEPGEYRVFNQFEETYSIRALADRGAAGRAGPGTQDRRGAGGEPARGDRTAGPSLRARSQSADGPRLPADARRRQRGPGHAGGSAAAPGTDRQAPAGAAAQRALERPGASGRLPARGGAGGVGLPGAPVLPRPSAAVEDVVSANRT